MQNDIILTKEDVNPSNLPKINPKKGKRLASVDDHEGEEDDFERDELWKGGEGDAPGGMGMAIR